MTDEKDIIDSGSHMLNFGSATKEKSSAKEHCCQVWLSSFREKKICYDFRRQIIVCSMSSIFYTIDELWSLCIDTLVLRFDNHVKMWDVWQDSHLKVVIIFKMFVN
jgi:hypothetical protein